MRWYAPNQHALCPHYQAPENIEKYDTQGIRPYALCVGQALAAPAGGSYILPHFVYILLYKERAAATGGTQAYRY